MARGEQKIMRTNISAMREAILRDHGCASAHTQSVPVLETLNGKVMWDGVVGVFKLYDHPQAKVCFAWEYADWEGNKHCATALSPPVDTPLAAIRAFYHSTTEKAEYQVRGHFVQSCKRGQLVLRLAALQQATEERQKTTRPGPGSRRRPAQIPGSRDTAGKAA